MTVLTLALLTGAAGLAIAAWAIREWRTDQRAARDTEERRVIEGVVLLAGDNDVPIIPGRPALPVARSPLADKAALQARIKLAERAGEQAEARVAARQAIERLDHKPRHAQRGPRDPRLDALLTTTQQFDAIVEHETGHAPLEHGPVEIVHPRRTWVAATAAQPTLWEA